jgi:mRNA interferase RelE/StbE
MSYTIGYTPRAARSLARLTRPVFLRVDKAISSLADTPRPRGCVKMSGYTVTYRLRVGEYRIIYDIDDAREMVSILFVAHRREVYRGF